MASPLPIPKLKASEPVPFMEAIQWFRQQTPWISGSSWNTMASLAALKGDQISGTVLLSMLDDVWGQMDRAVAEGKPYGEFVRDVAKVLDARWYQADSARLRLIYHNNVGSALMAGRYAQMSDPAVVEARPFVLFDGIGDWRQSPICKERDGIILPADDPWWAINSPLLHHGCRSGVITLDEEDARNMGGQTAVSKILSLPKPAAGWGKRDDWQNWKPEGADYHPALYGQFQAWSQGQAYAHNRDQWLDTLTASLKRGDVLPADAALVIPGYAPKEVTPEEIQRPLKVAKPEKDTTETIAHVIDQWVHGSKRKTSVMAKQAVINEFGLPGVAYSRVQWKIDPDAVTALQPAMRQLYDDTQSALKERYPNGTIKVYRGIKEGYALVGAMESWTTDYAMAVKFDGGKNGDILEMDVPIEHVLAFSGGPHWKNGKFGEQSEFVLLSSWTKETR